MPARRKCRPSRPGAPVSEPATIGFRAADTPEAQAGLAELQARYEHAARGGRRDRRARRRRLHARDPARVHRAAGADLRHEPRHGRLPAQQLPGARACRSGSRRRSGAASPAAHARACRNGEVEHGLGINEVSLFRETRQAANLRIEIDGVVRLESWSATASWSPPRPAAPPTTSRPMDRSCRSAPICWRSPRSARSARGAGAAPCCRAGPSSAQRDRPRQAAGQRGRRLHRDPRRGRGARSGRTAASRSPCCSTPSTISRSGS